MPGILKATFYLQQALRAFNQADALLDIPAHEFDQLYDYFEQLLQTKTHEVRHIGVVPFFTTLNKIGYLLIENEVHDEVSRNICTCYERFEGMITHENQTAEMINIHIIYIDHLNYSGRYLEAIHFCNQLLSVLTYRNDIPDVNREFLYNELNYQLQTAIDLNKIFENS